MLLAFSALAHTVEIGGIGVQRGFPVAIRLHVEARPGTGKVFLLRQGVLYGLDFQISIDRAEAWVRGRDPGLLEKTDLVLSIRHDFNGAIILEGESLGGALAVAILAAAEGRKIKPGVLITAALQEGGTLGSVIYMREKLEVARALKAPLLLVPPHQKVEDAGVPMVEVPTVEAALPYLLAK